MRKTIWVVSFMAIVMIVGTASALPEILDVFNKKYDTLGTSLNTCETCHIQGKWQRPLISYNVHIDRNKRILLQDNITLNDYGMDLKKNLDIGVSKALSAIEPLDSDKDKISNIDEIKNLTFPGDKTDFPIAGKTRSIKHNNPSTQAKDIINYSAINNYSPP